MSTLDLFLSELEVDTKLDEFTIKDVQMKLPGIKHKWSGRLIRAKIEISTLDRQRLDKITDIAKQILSESTVRVSEPLARKKAEEHVDVVSITLKIRDVEFLIEFCERAEKILSSMTYDIKNLCDIMKLETQ